MRQRRGAGQALVRRATAQDAPGCGRRHRVASRRFESPSGPAPGTGPDSGWKYFAGVAVPPPLLALSTGPADAYPGGGATLGSAATRGFAVGEHLAVTTAAAA